MCRLRLLLVCLTTGIAFALAADCRSDIVIDPGPIGTVYTSKDFAFTDLNGTVASGQTISIDFTFPNGVDAVYRYDNTGSRQLYGWFAGLNFQGGTTVTTQPFVSGVVPIDANGDPVAAPVGTLTLFNSSFSSYHANYNSTNSLSNLVAFTDVPYHGVRMNLRLPAYAESGVTVTGGVFGFRRNGTGESTEIIQAVPEASSFVCVSLIGLAFLIRRAWPH